MIILSFLQHLSNNFGVFGNVSRFVRWAQRDAVSGLAYKVGLGSVIGCAVLGLGGFAARVQVQCRCIGRCIGEERGEMTWYVCSIVDTAFLFLASAYSFIIDVRHRDSRRAMEGEGGEGWRREADGDCRMQDFPSSGGLRDRNCKSLDVASMILVVVDRRLQNADYTLRILSRLSLFSRREHDGWMDGWAVNE